MDSGGSRKNCHQILIRHGDGRICAWTDLGVQEFSRGADGRYELKHVYAVEGLEGQIEQVLWSDKGYVAIETVSMEERYAGRRVYIGSLSNET
jgi:hypothetical protein